MTSYLSADDLRGNLRTAVADYTDRVGPVAVEQLTLNITLPPNVWKGAEILGVDLPAYLEQLAVEHGWSRWSVRFAAS